MQLLGDDSETGVTLATDMIPPESRWLAERYEFVREIGHGGMSTVFLAHDRETGREVAVKLVDTRHGDDSEAAQRFAREARTAATLEHPNIVETVSIEESDGAVAAIVTAYVRGTTLRDALRADGPFTCERTVRVLRDVASAVAHAHSWGIVHRDVKPANIIIEQSSGRALLTDFGIARPLGNNNSLLTVAGLAVGTPTYMAPEQISGHDVDERADVYALGLLGWEMLTALQPWQGETLYSVLHKQQHEPLPDLARIRPEIPVYLLTAINVALRKDPATRWRDATLFLAQLDPKPVTPVFGAAANDDAGAAANCDTIQVRHRARPGPLARVAAPVAVGAEPRIGSSRSIADIVRTGEGRIRLRAPIAGVIVAGLFLFGLADRDRAAERWPPSVDAATESVLVLATASRPAASGTSGRRLASVAGAAPSRAGNALSSWALRDTTIPEVRCGFTTAADQRACLAARTAGGEAALNQAYGDLVALLRRESGPREPPSVAALRAEESAWLDVRHRECAARTGAAEGPLWGVARAPCYAEMATQRAAELRARLVRFGGR